MSWYMGDQEMVDRIIMMIAAAGIVSAGWLMQDGPDVLIMLCGAVLAIGAFHPGQRD
jgi:hypothetical protein